MINQIYTINLKKAKERRAFQIKMSNYINFPINIFSAIDGNNLKLINKIKLMKNKLLGFDLFSTCPFIFFFNGTLACSLSHYKLIKSIKNYNGNTLITEDDNQYLSSDFIKKVNNLLNKIPNNWDIIFFNHKNIFNKTNRCKSFNKKFYKLENKSCTDIFSNVTLDGNCYLINKNFCKKYLKYKVTDHADFILTRLNLNVYITKDILVKQLNNVKSYRKENDFMHTNIIKHYKKEIIIILCSLCYIFWIFI